MSSFKHWWESRSSREKIMLLLLLLLINAALFFQLNNSHFSDMPAAQTNTVRQASAPAPKAPQPVTASAVLPTPANSLRDPFRPPAGLNVLPTTEAPPLSNGFSSSAAASTAATSGNAKPAASPPRLTGIIVSESGKKLAIIEDNGNSRYYGLYDEIGSSNVSAITSDSITLTGPNGSRQLTLRR